MDRGHGDLCVHAQRRGIGTPGLGKEGCEKKWRHMCFTPPRYLIILSCLIIMSQRTYSVGGLHSEGLGVFTQGEPPLFFCWLCLSVRKEARSENSDISSVATLSPTCKKQDGTNSKKEKSQKGEKPKESQKPCSLYAYALVYVCYHISYVLVWWSDLMIKSHMIWYDMIRYHKWVKKRSSN